MRMKKLERSTYTREPYGRLETNNESVGCERLLGNYSEKTKESGGQGTKHPVAVFGYNNASHHVAVFLVLNNSLCTLFSATRLDIYTARVLMCLCSPCFIYISGRPQASQQSQPSKTIVYQRSSSTTCTCSIRIPLRSRHIRMNVYF